MDPTDEEASRVFEELKVHLAEVEKEYTPIQEDLVNELDHLSDDELDLKAAHALMGGRSYCRYD